MRAVKIRAFSVFKANFHALKLPKCLWKWFSIKNMKLVEHFSLKLFFVLMIFKRFYLVKIGLIFDGSQLSFMTWYHKILSICLSGCKNYWFLPENPQTSTTVITNQPLVCCPVYSFCNCTDFSNFIFAIKQACLDKTFDV